MLGAASVTNLEGVHELLAAIGSVSLFSARALLCFLVLTLWLSLQIP